MPKPFRTPRAQLPSRFGLLAAITVFASWASGARADVCFDLVSGLGETPTQSLTADQVSKRVNRLVNVLAELQRDGELADRLTSVTQVGLTEGKRSTHLARAAESIGEPVPKWRAFLSRFHSQHSRVQGITQNSVDAIRDISAERERVLALIPRIERLEGEFVATAQRASAFPELREAEAMTRAAASALAQVRARIEVGEAGAQMLVAVLSAQIEIMSRSSRCLSDSLCEGGTVYLIREPIPRDTNFPNLGRLMVEGRYQGAQRLTPDGAELAQIFLYHERGTPTAAALPDEVIRGHILIQNEQGQTYASSVQGLLVKYSDGITGGLYGVFPNGDHLVLVGQGTFRRVDAAKLLSISALEGWAERKSHAAAALRFLGYHLERLSLSDRKAFEDAEHVWAADFEAGKLVRLHHHTHQQRMVHRIDGSFQLRSLQLSEALPRESR
jgi:hypothetical protein